MNQKKLYVIILVIAALFAAGWIVGSVFQPTIVPTFAQGDQAKKVDIELLKSQQGFDFSPAADSVKPTITEQQALATANGNIPATKEATNFSAELGSLSSPAMVQALERGEAVDPKYADMGLVWILIFDGIETVSNGPPGSEKHSTNELNVVISAITGEELFAFTYR